MFAAFTEYVLGLAVGSLVVISAVIGFNLTHFGSCRKRRGLVLAVVLGPEQPQQEKEHMDIQITRGFKRPFTLAPTDAAGNPAQLDGPIRFEEFDGVTASLNEDGLSGFINAAAEVGSGSVDLIADADLGEGVEELRVSINVETIHPRAKNLGLNIGEEVPQ